MNIQVWPGDLSRAGTSWTYRKFKRTGEVVQDSFHYENFNIGREEEQMQINKAINSGKKARTANQ